MQSKELNIVSVLKHGVVSVSRLSNGPHVILFERFYTLRSARAGIDSFFNNGGLPHYDLCFFLFLL